MIYLNKYLTFLQLFSIQERTEFIEKKFGDFRGQRRIVGERLPDSNDGVVERQVVVVKERRDGRRRVVNGDQSNRRQRLTFQFVAVEK